MGVTDDLWEAHADWWIDGFTEGADPEYTEQILPMAFDELSGFGRMHASRRSATGQVASMAWSRR